jgi:hypothetical protein
MCLRFRLIESYVTMFTLCACYQNIMLIQIAAIMAHTIRPETIKNAMFCIKSNPVG